MPPPLGRLTAARFLRTYWQRKPLLVRGAFPGFLSPLTPEGLAFLSCEKGVESRLVLERSGARPWQVVPGPQSARRLRRLPASRWSLLVQGVDRLVPAVAALRESFRFLPDWRIDDVMVSFAPRFGSVGPHVDSYDVFLLQGLGHRRWDIDPQARPDFRPGLDLRILKRFRPRSRFVLGPGDMLYLPAGVGHHGVALHDCMTFSIGFRAPSGREVLATMLQKGLEAPLYRDPPLRPARHPGEITPAAVEALRDLVRGALRGPAFETAMGELLTEPGTPAVVRRVDPNRLARRLHDGASLEHAPGARLAFRRDGARAWLFAEGEAFSLSRGLAFAGPLLTGRARLEPSVLRPHVGREGFLDLLARLVAVGAIVVSRRR